MYVETGQGQFYRNPRNLPYEAFMTESPDRSESVLRLIKSNQALLRPYYKLAAILLVALLLLHFGFTAYLTAQNAFGNWYAVSGFVVFNVTAIIIEVVMSRIAFLLAARLGQLRDIEAILAMLGSPPDPEAFEKIAKAFTALRRDSSASLKIVDLESLASTLKKSK